jgi:hypothetical protein
MKTRTIRPTRGDRALLSAGKDVAYELDMARKAAALALNAKAAGDQDRVNLFLEAFLLHVRNLRDFLAWSNNHNNVIAADFLGRPVRVRMPLLRSPAVRARLNRRIAHLSYSRARLGRGWNVPALLAEVEVAMRRFTDRLKLVRPRLARRLGAA